MMTTRNNGLKWCDAEPPRPVHSIPGIGLYVPAYSPDAVNVGHYDETFDYYTKTQTALDVLTGKQEIMQFDVANHIRYVIWTSDLPAPPPSELGAPAYDTPTFKVWRLY